MAHSIIEFNGAHVILRDDYLLTALQWVDQTIEERSDLRLPFVSEFLKSDLVHMSGALDPSFETHLANQDTIDAALAALEEAHRRSVARQELGVAETLSKITKLISTGNAGLSF